MNEIKHIHLGRQSFTISVEAYKELHEYLEAIKTQVGKKGDVVDEVEMRMAELLEERGIHDEKVVLPEDVQFLKEQLGEPHDFKDEDDDTVGDAKSQESGQKRLFRDGDTAMFAGVAAGLAAFFGIDVTIVRLIFVLLTVFGGSGILIYVLLWLIVPEAKTNSERLQMRGKAVTVDSLKEVVDRANIAGAAERVGKVGQQLGRGVGRQLGLLVERGAKLLLGLIGCILIAMAVVLFSGTAVSGAYMLAHGGKMANEVVFPVGSEAVWGLLCAVIVLMIFAFFVLVAGLAMIRRKSVIKGWVLGILSGIFLIAGSAGTMIGFDIAPQIRDKYRALHHSQTIDTAQFTKLNITGKNVNYEFVPDDKYAVEVQYFGSQTKVNAIQQTVTGDVLTIDSSKYTNEGDHCTIFCFYSGDWLVVKIHAPTLAAAEVHGSNVNLAFGEDFKSDELAVTVAPHNWAALRNVSFTKVTTDTVASVSGRHVVFQGVRSTNEYNDVMVSGEELNIDHTPELTISGQKMCDGDMPTIFLQQAPSILTVNGVKVEPPTRQGLTRLWQLDTKNAYNCVTII